MDLMTKTTGDNQKNHYLNIIGPALLALFFFINPSFAKKTKLKIAILDTGFCPKKLQPFHPHISIRPPMDFANKAFYSCDGFDLKNRRYHGHLVLSYLVEQLNPKNQIEIQPMVIFDSWGKQKIGYWKKALDWAHDHNFDIIIAAAGLPIEKKQNYPLKAITFLSSGRSGIGIKANSKLFPQELHLKNQVFLIGSYHPPISQYDKTILEDPKLLYKNEIDYYFSGGLSSDLLRGSSLAVALALRKALNLCENSFKDHSLGQCLKKYKKEIKLDNKLSLPTF